MELPSGYAVSESRPGGKQDAQEEPTAAQVDPSVQEGTVIAVFEPDGTAAMSGDRFLTVGADTMEVRIARWTGALTLSEPLAADAAAPAEDEGGDPHPSPASGDEDALTAPVPPGKGGWR